jgi:hypothetical protein
MTPTYVALRTSLPPEWAGPVWGGLALAAFGSE